MSKYLAQITALEDYKGKDYVKCKILFITGRRMLSTMVADLPAGIFNFYYFGSVLEVVEISEDVIMNVYDVNKDTAMEFGISMCYALSYNSATHEVLASNGFVYNLDESLFATQCPEAWNNIKNITDTVPNFAMCFYTLKGAIVSILFDYNVSVESHMYKYVLSRGFVVSDKKVLRGMTPTTYHNSYTVDPSQKLTQQEIDDMLKVCSW